MKLFKHSFFSGALSILVLFASVAPSVAIDKIQHKKGSKRRPKFKSNPSKTLVKKSKQETSRAKPKLSWQDKFRKKFTEIKTTLFDLVEENPLRAVAAVVGSAVAVWLIWKFGHSPWTHRENVIGNSPCQIMEWVAPQGYNQTIQHVRYDRAPGQEGDVVPQNVQVQYRLDNQTPIIQLRVAGQWFDASCAYHATKNCMMMINELVDGQGDVQHQLMGERMCQDLFGQNGVWRQLILADPANLRHGDCMQGGDWLSGEAVRQIVEHERREDDGNLRLLRDRNVPITIIENAYNIAHPVDDPVFNATQVAHNELAQAQQNNQVYTHGFIFNSARTRIVNGQPVAPARDNGHWMAAVVHRNAQGQIQWYCANSSNRSMFQYPVLQDLIVAVQGAQVQILGDQN